MNLTNACEEQDIIVTIGTQPCNVTFLSPDHLICSPPPESPKGTDEIGIITESNLPMVIVRVGKNLRFPIGYLHYDVIQVEAMTSELTMGIAAGAVFTVMVLIVILLIYCQRSTQAERDYKRIQIQMDNLETNMKIQQIQGRDY